MPSRTQTAAKGGRRERKREVGEGTREPSNVPHGKQPLRSTSFECAVKKRVDGKTSSQRKAHGRWGTQRGLVTYAGGRCETGLDWITQQEKVGLEKGGRKKQKV